VITLRRTVDEDAAAVADIFLRSFHATYEFPLAHTDDEVREWVRERLVPQMETWIAVDDAGAALGFATVEPGWLEQLYVDPDHLGKGIGRLLLDRAKERQPDGLLLWTFQVNDRARRFYERNGFEASQMTDGTGNEERQPDVQYRWQPAGKGAGRSPAPQG
jgi:GNAT superfamily N-acetyltransferase